MDSLLSNSIALLFDFVCNALDNDMESGTVRLQLMRQISFLYVLYMSWRLLNQTNLTYPNRMIQCAVGFSMCLTSGKMQVVHFEEDNWTNCSRRQISEAVGKTKNVYCSNTRNSIGNLTQIPITQNPTGNEAIEWHCRLRWDFIVAATTIQCEFFEWPNHYIHINMNKYFKWLDCIGQQFGMHFTNVRVYWRFNSFYNKII